MIRFCSPYSMKVSSATGLQSYLRLLLCMQSTHVMVGADDKGNNNNASHDKDNYLHS